MVVVLVLLMLFILPILDLDTYNHTKLLQASSVALMVKLYDDRKSWDAYIQAVEISKNTMSALNEDQS